MKNLRSITFRLLAILLFLPAVVQAQPQPLVPVILETRAAPFLPHYVGDLDLDGNMDIVGKTSATAFELHEWNGSAFVQRLVMTDPVQMRNFIVGDADADGIPEFMAAGASGGDVHPGSFRIWEADADNTYGLRYSTSYPALDASSPGDSDGDGPVDFLMTPGSPIGGLQRLKATADNTYDFLPGLTLPFASGGRIAAGAADFDGDGAPETVYADITYNKSLLYENDAIILEQVGQIQSVVLGTDMDNNGLGEFLVKNGTTWTLRESTGSGDNFQDVWTSSYDGVAAMVDADGDGQAELFLRPNAAPNTFTLSHRSGSSLITYVDSGSTFQSWPDAVSEPLYLGDSNGVPLIAVRQGTNLHIVTFTPPNQPPVADAGGPYSGEEGAAIALDGATASDPDDDALTYAWSVDSTLCSFDDASALNPNLTCVDNGEFTATLTVSDGVNDPVSSDATVTVANVAPAVGLVSVPTEPIDINNQPVTGVSAPFTDPGTADTHTCTVDYGDGSGPQGGTVAGGTCTGPDRTYTEAGVYEVTVEVTDDDLGVGSAMATSFIVIYDPEGGFVTGGGWIMSPAEACPDFCGGATGKANFGFVSKYKKGADTPTGQTEFQFKAGDLNFHSSSYQWLVVAGANAKYKGVGTINGGGNYGFMLTATDAELASNTDVDLFRIKIWDRDNGDVVVYDNKMGADDDGYDGTEIGGGNIKIHKAK